MSSTSSSKTKSAVEFQTISRKDSSSNNRASEERFIDDPPDKAGGGGPFENNGSEEEEEEEEEEERAQWGNSLQFFFTILGFCVGLGNIWRFPYLCQQNGGGAFVIPFLIMMILEGMPLLLLELGMGQRFRQGSLGVWNMVHPWLGGIGLGSTVIACIVGIYYNVIIAWCIYYLVKSIGYSLPWSECPMELVGNLSLPIEECDMSSETQYFWYREALDITSNIGDPDGIRWWMFLSLLVAWIVVYAIIMKGIQSSGKVVYFTALFPYVVLTIFFIRGITLKGAGAGLAHMFYPKMEKLLQPRVWLDAANQVFYSYGLAFGSIISFGSYNPPDKNCVWDVFQITLCNAFTAVYACAVIFAILGFKAQHLFDKCMEHDVGILMSVMDIWKDREASSISESEYTGIMESHIFNATAMEEHGLHNCSMAAELDQAAQGTGLAFIVMADVFTKLPGAPLWSLLFFAMLLSLGLGSQIGILEGVVGTLFDMPQLKQVKRPLLTGIACLGCFAVGLLFTTGAGEYWLTLFDAYGAMGLTLIAFAEIMAVMYVYGHKNFTEDIKNMTGISPGIYWQLTWRFIAPILLGLILVASVISQIRSSPTYQAWDKDQAKSVDLPYPSWSLGIAFMLAIASLIPIITIAALSACNIHVFDSKIYKMKMRRIDTNASTRPMMSTFEEFHDIPMNREDDDQNSEDSDRGIVVDNPASPLKSNKADKFQIEVLE